MFCLGTERIIQNLATQNHPFQSLAVRSTIVLWLKCASTSLESIKTEQCLPPDNSVPNGVATSSCNLEVARLAPWSWEMNPVRLEVVSV